MHASEAYRHHGAAFSEHHRVRRTGRLMMAITLAGLVQPVNAQIDSYTYYEMIQSDLLSGGPPFVYDTQSGTDGATFAGFGQANVAGDLTTFYQGHSVNSRIGTSPGVPGETVSMVADRNHEFRMRGTDENSLWLSTQTYVYGHTHFRDQISFQVQGHQTSALATVEYVWNLSGLFTHILDIPDTAQRPLYRLHDRLRFAADAGGAEVQPIDIQVDIYDPHTAGLPGPPMWSVLQQDVNLIEQSIPGIFGDTTLTATIQPDAGSGYAPVVIDAMLIIETRNNFLNDGPELNYYLQGNTRLNFANSADLLGIILRDETGAIRTDVEVTSALGLDYILLPEPASGLLLASIFWGWDVRRRLDRRRR